MNKSIFRICFKKVVGRGRGGEGGAGKAGGVGGCGDATPFGKQAFIQC